MKKFVAVRVKFEKKFKNPVSLKNIKKIKATKSITPYKTKQIISNAY